MTTEYAGTLHRLNDTDLTVATPDDDIRGRKVVDLNGEDVGKVEDLLLDESEGKVRFMEVSSGGFLGIGKEKAIVPIDAIQAITEDEVRLGHARAHIAGAPEYDPDLVAEGAQNYWNNLYGYYGYMPYWTGGYVYPAYPYYPVPK